ncbi:hypothetical protein ACHAXN_013099 [Cyclotella atomus]
MPAVFFDDYNSPMNAAAPEQAHSGLVHSPGNPNGHWSHYDVNQLNNAHFRPTSPSFSTSHTMNSFSHYNPSASPSPPQSLSAEQQQYASPDSTSTAALFAQHQRHYANQARYYQKQQQQQQQVEPRHFQFSQSGSFQSPSDSQNDRLNSPKESRLAPPAQSTDETFDDPLSPGVCQDERDGLSSLFNCSLISPKEGDERNDVLSEDEDDLFLFSENEDDAEEKGGASSTRTSPSTEEIAKSISCCSQEADEMEKKALSPVSLADDGTLDDEDTVEDTSVSDEEECKVEKAASNSKPAEAAPKKKKSVTIQTKDEIHEYQPLTPHYSPTETKNSLLEQARQRDPHADINPYSPHVEIPDDESEASMLVLMRYIGCTAQTYGEQKPLPEGVGLSDGKDFLASESDDDTTLSGWTYESSVHLNISTNETYEEVGIEMTIEECLPPSLRLVSSVSVDEGTGLSVASLESMSLVKSQSDPCESATYEESYENAVNCSPTDERSMQESVAKGSPTNESAAVSLDSDPVAAAMKAVHAALTPRVENSDMAEKKSELNKVTNRAKGTAKDVASKVEKVTPEKAKPVSTMTKTAASSDNTQKAPLPRRKPDITVQTDRSPIPPRKTLAMPSDESQSEAASPASVAKAFLASTADASKSNDCESKQTKPATSSATEAKNCLASPMSVVSRATLGSIVTKDDDGDSIATLSKAPVTLPEKPSVVPVKKHPVDDLIKAYLAQSKDVQIDNQALMSAMSPTALKSPSVQMLLRSNILSNHPAPKNQPTPRVTNISTGKKIDPPQKKLEPSFASMSKKENTKPSMTRLEMKLSQGKPKPIKTEQSLEDLQIDHKNSALSPISAISEGTMDTINTEALISLARRTSSNPVAKVENSSDGKDVRSKPVIATIDEASAESEVSNLLKAARKATGREAQKSQVVSQTELARKTTPKHAAKPDENNIEQAKENKAQNKSKVNLDSYKAQVEKHRQELNALRNKAKGSVPSPELPEESSSFDKNEVTKETKSATQPETPCEKRKEPTVAIVSPDEASREQPPPLIPYRQSVSEVDELLSKTRNWLSEHNKARTTTTTTTSSAKQPSLLSRQVDTQRRTTRKLASPSATEKSIREELAALKARQVRNDRARQFTFKSMGV